jgi:hypothetical protein
MPGPVSSMMGKGVKARNLWGGLACDLDRDCGRRFGGGRRNRGLRDDSWWLPWRISVCGGGDGEGVESVCGELGRRRKENVRCCVGTSFLLCTSRHCADGEDKRQVEYSLCWTRGDEGNEFKVGAGMREWVLWYVGICVTA